MAVVRVSTQGRVVIPEELGEGVRTSEGAQLRAPEGDGEVGLTVSLEDPIEAGYGMFRHLGPTLAEFLEMRREERDLEERRLDRWLKRQ